MVHSRLNISLLAYRGFQHRSSCVIYSISSAREIALTFPQIICGSSDLYAVCSEAQKHETMLSVCLFACFLGLALNSTTTTATYVDTAGVWHMEMMRPKRLWFQYISRNCTFHWFKLLLYKMVSTHSPI